MVNNKQNYKQSKSFFSKAKSLFKSFISSKKCIALTFALLGICGTVVAQNLTKEEDPYANYASSKNYNDQFFDDSGFDQAFKEMDAMHRRMDAIFAMQRKRMENMFLEASEVKNESSKQAKVSKKEDEDSYEYELYFTGFDRDDIVVGIDGHALKFAAKNSEKNESKNSKSYRSSDFSYFFFLPDDAKTDDPKIVKKDDRVIVKLAKK